MHADMQIDILSNFI